MMPPFVVPFFVGLVTVPLVGLIVKPLMKGAVKATVGVGSQVKKMAAEASGDLRDLATEASADIAAADAGRQPDAPAVVPGSRSGAAGAASKRG